MYDEAFFAAIVNNSYRLKPVTIFAKKTIQIFQSTNFSYSDDIFFKLLGFLFSQLPSVWTLTVVYFWGSNIRDNWGSSTQLDHTKVGTVNLLHARKFTLREKCPFSEFFWSVFCRVWTEYREILRNSIVSKHGPNGLFYSLMLRTMLYYNLFLSNVHQNLNKRIGRAFTVMHTLL